MSETRRNRNRVLKQLELRLLRCTLTPYTILPWEEEEPAENANKWLQPLNTVVSHIENGDYREALASDAARMVFGHIDAGSLQDTKEAAKSFYCTLDSRTLEFLNGRQGCAEAAWIDYIDNDDVDVDAPFRVMLVVCLGIAALLVFVQQNFTGPCKDFPKFPLTTDQLEDSLEPDQRKEWDIWSNQQVMVDGSDLMGKCTLSQYFILSKILLMKAGQITTDSSNNFSDSLKTIFWWVSRLLLFQQKVLDEKSPSLYAQLLSTIECTLSNFGKPSKVSEYWEGSILPQEASDIAAAANLEAGIKELAYGRVNSARIFFQDSEAACSLKLSVTGKLGYRTIHQVEPKPQMVLVAESLKQENSEKNVVSGDVAILDKNMEVHQGCTWNTDNKNKCDSDVLLAPKLVDAKDESVMINSGNSDSNTMVLDSMRQTVVLAQCFHIMKSKPDDELKDWEMAPYIEAVGAQNLVYFMVRSCCQILRIRWENKRGRTKQRALQMMDELAHEIREGAIRVVDRMHYAFCIYFPTFSELLKEYAELLMSLGVIGDAIGIFEELQLWNNVIDCYCFLGKKPAAIDLIKERLQHNPDDPRLWCSLGDVTLKDEHYVRALEVSGNRFARAERSLARSAYNRGDYKKSQHHWEAALALNSLYPDGWFALGAAALKAQDLDKAIDGFTHAVQLDPDNGEAWNNVACLHMMRKRYKEAFVAFKEALKFRRNSWQMWENYSQVALNIGNFGQALEAIQKVLDLTNGKRFDASQLSALLEEMELRQITNDSGSTLERTSMEQGATDGTKSSFETDQIVELLGKILQQIVRSGEGGGEVWGLYARWHKYCGNTTSCLEALLKQVRAYQGSDLTRNEERFKKFTYASLELCEQYINIAKSSGSKRELNAAQMHLRNTIKLGEDFSNLKEFTHLETCLRTVNQLLEALPHC